MESVSPLEDARWPALLARLEGSFAMFRPWVRRISWAICIGLFLLHFTLLWRYAVNVPYVDDWGMFVGDNHPASIDLPWLYSQHNDHKPAVTRILVWLQFQINGWNVRTQILIDFIVYGLFLALLGWLARRITPQVSTWIVVAFFIFLLSPIISSEHVLAAALATHLWVIFFFFSAYFLFSELQKWPALLVACLTSILSLYSFASGLATSLVLLLAFWIFKCLRAYNIAGKKARSREFLQLLLATGLIGGALISWIIGYEKPTYHPPWTSPFTRVFWRFYLSLIALDFGLDRFSVVLGLICLLIILAPICGEVWKKRGQLSGIQWASFAVVVALLGDLALISTGRAGFGVEWLWVQRYAEHGMPLIILSVLNWSVFLKHSPRLRATVLVALWFFCFVAFSNNWDFGFYKDASLVRRADVRCIRAYYSGAGDCPIAFRPIPSCLDQAKRLNASFYQDVIKASRKTSSGPPAYFGAHDVADCHHIAGWAYDKSDPDAVVAVAIYDGDLLLSNVPAATFRRDLLDAGIGNGLYSFEYETPPALKDGRPHSIRVRFASTTLDLPNTPTTLTCSPP